MGTATLTPTQGGLLLSSLSGSSSGWSSWVGGASCCRPLSIISDTEATCWNAPKGLIEQPTDVSILPRKRQ